MLFNKRLPQKLCTLLLINSALFSVFVEAKTNTTTENIEKSTLQKRQSVKVPAMRNRVYAQLARAQKLADDGDKIAGFDVLDDVKEQLDNLNSYERAMLFNFYAFMYYGNDDIDNAIDSFKQVIVQQAIPDSLYLSTLYSLAQLSMQQQNYAQALQFLKQWQVNNGKPLTANQQVLFAQVYYQLKNYAQSLAFVSKAIASVEAVKGKKALPKENWLILQRADYYALKQPEKVTQVLEKLVRLYDKPQYWLQLSAMYGELGKEDKQLAVMEAAYQAGYVAKSNDITSLAQMYLYHGAPYKAAALLDNALAKGTVKAEEKYLSLLSQAFLAAKEPKKAIPVLKQLSNITEDGKYDAQLAQTYLNMEKWQSAIHWADQALAHKLTKQQGAKGTMYLVKGMAYYNLQQFTQSLTAFTQAETISTSQKIASQWKKYVTREQGYQQQLAMLKQKQ